MIHRWTSFLLVWTLALARGFSYPLVAQRVSSAHILSSPIVLTRTTLALLRGGQQGEDVSDYAATTEAPIEPETVAVIPDSVKLSAAPLAGMTTLLASLAKCYERSLAQRPIVTKSMTAGIIFGLSDY